MHREEAEVKELLEVFNCSTKRQLEKYCSSTTVTAAAFSALILAGRSGYLSPFKYACYFGENIPKDVQLNNSDYSALSEAKIGPLEHGAKKAVNKLFQTSAVRRIFSAHLFYTNNHRNWYLFYFDQRDMSDSGNHWKGGPHIHLVCDLWPNLNLPKVWNNAKEGEFPSGKIHLRYNRGLH